jgi:hypothetical protein
MRHTVKGDQGRLGSTPILFCFLFSTLFSALSVISWVIKLKWIRVWSEEKKGERFVESLKMSWRALEDLKNRYSVCSDGKW